MKLSVVIPTYNPDPVRFGETLAALGCQALDHDEWECVVVDNASTTPVDKDWCESLANRSINLVRESEPGLSHARLAGISQASADIIVFSDDDNVLQADYLQIALKHMVESPSVGVAGGRSIPHYQVSPPPWFFDGIAPLGCRDFGDEEHVFTTEQFVEEQRYPEKAPIGAGMVFRNHAMETWIRSVGNSGISDRKGSSLSSAGDCDMVLCALEAGYDAAYWPDLVLNHLIPEDRLTKSYLGAVSRAAFRDFIKVLDLHGIRPWSSIYSQTVPLRAARAWVKFQAWRDPVKHIRWQSAIGQFEGRAQLPKKV